MIPDIIKPYMGHPLVNNKEESDLELLDDTELNNIIRAEDQLIRSVREYYLDINNRGRLTPGNFSSSILNARGMTFLNVAYYKSNVPDICNAVWDITPTTAKRTSFNQTMKTSIIRRLDECGIIEFDSEKNNVLDFMPYPIGSKLFVQKNLREIPKLFEEQANHYNIVSHVQDIPWLTSELEANTPHQYQHNFFRDYSALVEIDAIRAQEVRGRNFTFSRSFLTGEKSAATWLNVLEEATDNIRTALKSLLEIQNVYGGFISKQEIMKATNWKERDVGQLMRYVDYLGIVKRAHTLDMKDALSRITSGTLLNLNYRELDNAEAILVLAREVPETIDIMNLLQKKKEVSEDDLIDEFNSIAVQQVKNSLEKIGLIKPGRFYDGIWELVPLMDNDRFITDVLTVCANSRQVLPSDYDITNQLADDYKKVDRDELHKKVEQMKLSFFDKTYEEIK
ncbi:Uncharacterised protein [uncultured archaeon]|nr:Uncharacterised protein [uncultured archaeon]